VLIRGVVDDELGDHLQAEPVGLEKHGAKVVERAELRVDVRIVRNVVAIVLQRRRVKGHEPDRVHAQVPDVFQFGRQPRKIADAVVVRVEEGLDVQLVDHRVLVPERIVDDQSRRGGGFLRW